MGKFQLNKKGDDPIKIYDDIFKIAQGTVETHLGKFGKQPNPISREASEGYVTFDKNGVTVERHDEEWEAEVQADSIGGYVQKEETSGGDLGGIIYDARESKAKEEHLDNIHWEEARDSGLPIIDKGRYYECDGKMVHWDGQEAWKAENFLKYNSIKDFESVASEAPHTIAEPDSTPQGDNYPTYYYEMSTYPYSCKKCGETLGSHYSYIQSMIDHLTEDHGITELSVEQTWNESTDRFEVDFENDQVIQKLPTDKRSFDVEADNFPQREYPSTRQWEKDLEEIRKDVGDKDWNSVEAIASEEDYSQYETEDVFPFDPDGGNMDEDGWYSNNYLTDSHYNMGYDDMYRLMVEQMKEHVQRELDREYSIPNYDQMISSWSSSHGGGIDLPSSKMDTPEAQRALASARDEIVRYIRDLKQNAEGSLASPSWESVEAIANEGHELDDQSSDFQYHKADSSDLLRTDQRTRNPDGSISYNDKTGSYRQGQVGRADYKMGFEDYGNMNIVQNPDLDTDGYPMDQEGFTRANWDDASIEDRKNWLFKAGYDSERGDEYEPFFSLDSHIRAQLAKDLQVGGIYAMGTGSL